MTKKLGRLVLVVAVCGCARDAAAPGSDAGDAASILQGGGASPPPGAFVAMFDGRRAQLLAPGLRVSAADMVAARPVRVWAMRTVDVPWGNVGPAYDLGPTGTVFDQPLTVEFDLDEIDLPPGTDAASLRVATVIDGRWVPVGAAGRRAPGRPGVAPRLVTAELRHLSPYGLVADPHEVSGAGRRFASNGIVAETADEVFARLFVSPAIVTLYVDGGRGTSTTLTLSGLPTDDSHLLYVDSGAVPRTIGPAGGGTVTLPLDLSSPRFLWLQPYSGTAVIGGPDDACGTVGVRSGSTCTLTSDIVDGVLIAQDGQTLDCDGHTILPPAAWPGRGIGIKVSQVEGVTIRRCNVGTTGRGFGVGIWAFSATATTISDCLLTDDAQGILVSNSGGTTVRDNRVAGEMVTGISVQDEAWTAADGTPPPAPVDVAGNTMDVVSGEKAAGIELRGTSAAFKDGAGGTTLAPATVHDNAIDGGGNGIVLASVTDAEIGDNDVDGAERGLLILDAGWPNRRGT